MFNAYIHYTHLFIHFKLRLINIKRKILVFDKNYITLKTNCGEFELIFFTSIQVIKNDIHNSENISHDLISQQRTSQHQAVPEINKKKKEEKKGLADTRYRSIC